LMRGRGLQNQKGLGRNLLGFYWCLVFCPKGFE
jgi:hypothetical protein